MIANEENSSNGVFNARQRAKTLYDAGTFVEIGTYVKRRTTEYDLESGNEFEGVVTGYGSIKGNLVFSFIQDFARTSGALSFAQSEKIRAIYKLALENGAPVIGVFDSAGAKILEGIDALAGYGKIMKCVTQAAGRIPQIALVVGNCTGASAAIAQMFDFVVCVEEKSDLYVTPKFVSGTKLTSEMLAKTGTVDFCYPDEPSAMKGVAKLISMLPSNSGSGTVLDRTKDDMNRATPEICDIINEKYDVKNVIDVLADNKLTLETSRLCAPELYTGFMKLNGKTVGVVANNKNFKSGMLTPNAASKASRFVHFCDSFSIPLLTLVDTDGLESTEEAELSAYSTKLAELAQAYAASMNAKVTVVLGKAYGSAYTFMGSKSIGADVVFSLDRADISIMDPKSAVNFIWGNKIKSSENPQDTEEELISIWKSEMSSPLSAARSGNVDDIIEPAEMRQRILAAFEMLSMKNTINYKW